MSDQPLGSDADITADVSNNGPVTQDTAPVGSDGGGNPAWNEILEALPSSLHSQVRPHLEKWDKGVNERFTQVQSQYAPYKDFVGIDPQQIQASLQLANLIATDPRAFYDRMSSHYGEEWGLAGQGQGDDSADDYSLDDGEEEGFNLESDPRFRQLQEQQNTIAQFLAADLERKQQAEYESEVATQHQKIDEEFAAVAQANGMEELPPQAMKMIISLCTANDGVTIQQAAEEVMPLFAAQKAPAPRIMSPGGGVPANHLDTRNMNAKDTKDLVAQILASRANGQG